MKKMIKIMCVLFVFIFSVALPFAAAVAAENSEGSQEEKIALANALLDDPTIRGLMSAMFETKLMIMTGRMDEPNQGIIGRPEGRPSDISAQDQLETARSRRGAFTGTAEDQLETSGPQEDLVFSLGPDVQVNNSGTDTGLSTTQSETTIRVSPNTGTICSCYNDSQHWAVGAIAFSGFSRSIDGGATFIDRGGFPAGGGGNSFGDPSLEWRAADGYFYYASLHTNGLGLWRSTDDCDNFTFLSMIHTGGGDDKELMAVDNNATSSYYGRFYVAWTDFNAGARIYLTYSDNGTTWSTPVALSGVSVSVQGAWPAVAPNGDVYVAWVRWNPYPTGPIDIEIARSTDGGATFGLVTNPMTGKVNPYEITATSNCGRPALNANGTDGIRYLPSPQIVVGPDGCLHVVYSYDPDGNGTGDVIDVFYRRSCDEGATWGPEIRLNDDATLTDQWFPTVSVGPSNVVVATWYDRRNDTANNYLFDYYKALSFDGGVTWDANIRVSDVSSEVPILEPNFDPIVASCYHGDYDQQVQDGEFVYIQWSDDRNYQNAHPDPDIWFEKESTLSTRWVLETPIPQPSMDSVVVEYNGETYVVAGYGSGGLAYKYNPTIDAWTPLANQPSPTIDYPVDGSLGYDGGGNPKIFIIPDTTSLQTNMMVYDINGDSWSTIALSGGFTARWAPDLAYDPGNNMIYISGGATAPGGGNLNELWSYNPATNTFTQLASFTSARDFHASWYYNGKLYIAGGINVSSVALSSTQVYDIASNTWSAENADLGPLPETRWGMGDARQGAKLWLMAGMYDMSLPVRTSGYFDLDAGGSWVDAPDLVEAVFRVEGDVQRGDPYLVGGSIGGFSYQAYNQHYLSPVQSHVLIIKDEDPWGYPSNETVLSSLGIAYDVINSASIATADFVQYCLIIIASDQPQSFYDTFDANLAKFNSFVESGGILQLNACDMGFNPGFWNVLPGGVTHETDLDDQNFVVQPDHPIVSGIPSPFNGNAASHGHFLNVPGDAVVITQDEADLPTTIVYNRGVGTVVASMVTLEIGYNYDWDFAAMLPNTIQYTYSLCGGICAEDDTGQLDIVGIAGGPGTTVTVPVRIQTAPNGVAALGFEVRYNTGILDYVGYTRGDCVTGFDIFNVNEVSPGLLRVGGFDPSVPIPGGASCVVVNLEFNVLTCEEGRVYQLGDLQALVDDLAGWTASGACFQCGCSCDVNGDGDVTPVDALCAFQKYLSICPTSCGPCEDICCDVTMDGDCTPADALEIFKEYLALPSICSD